MKQTIKNAVLGLLYALFRLTERNRLKFLARYHTAELYRRCARMGHGVQVNGRLYVSYHRGLTIGNNVHIGDNAHFATGGGVIIGDNVHISRNLTIYSANHNFEGTALPYDITTVDRPVFIGRNAWIGMNVSILPGVSVGEGAIVGMGSVVTRNVAAGDIVGGVPAAKVKSRDAERYARLEAGKQYGGKNGRLLPPEEIARYHSTPASLGRNLVFVVSTGRSGTTTMAEMLNKHAEIRAMHEPHLQLVKLSTDYAAGRIDAETTRTLLRRIYGTAGYCDRRVYLESDQKLSNLIPLLAELFPQARFIWLVRRASDVVASTTARGWFSRRDLNLNDRENLDHKHHYQHELSAAEAGDMSGAEWDALSLFERNCWYWSYWNRCIQSSLAALPKERSFLVRLEELEARMPDLLKFLGVSQQAVTVEVTNQARSYKPKAASGWSEDEKAAFAKRCAPLDDELYPSGN